MRSVKICGSVSGQIRIIWPPGSGSFGLPDPDPYHFGLPDPGCKKTAKIMRNSHKNRQKNARISYFRNWKLNFYLTHMNNNFI